MVMLLNGNTSVIKKMAFRVFTHSHTIKQIVTEAKPASEVEAF